MLDPEKQEEEIRRALVSRFGCFGHLVHVLALSAILAPAGCAGLLVMGDGYSWPSAMLGLLTFLIVGLICSVPVGAMIKRLDRALPKRE